MSKLKFLSMMFLLNMLTINIPIMVVFAWYNHHPHITHSDKHGFIVPYSAQQLPWQPCGKMLLSNPPRCGDDDGVRSDDPGLLPLAK